MIYHGETTLVFMGVVYRPEDVLKGRKRVVEMGTRDLNPGVRDIVVRVLEAWEGKASEDQLVKLVGKERAKHLIEALKAPET